MKTGVVMMMLVSLLIPVTIVICPKRNYSVNNNS